MCNDCAVLYEKMKSQEYEMYQLRKAITNLRGELKYERKEKAKLLKERGKQNHYRNGQKRGAHGRNG